MAEFTKEYFDEQYKDLVVFLTDQFGKVATSQALKDGFSEQETKLNFIQVELAALRKGHAALSKRTKEDDSAFVKELLKLKNRMDQFEKQLKKLKAVHA